MSSPIDHAPWELNWEASFSVGIPEIDADHQRFIGLVNALNAAIITRRPIDEIKVCLRAVQADAVAHFAHEEVLFKRRGYPEAAEHAQRHAEILQALRDITDEATTQGLEYEWIAVGLQIKQVLNEHLLTEDMKYRDFHRAHQTRLAAESA
jgi:hemerythrin-like metal-binding protein